MGKRVSLFHGTANSTKV